MSLSVILISTVVSIFGVANSKEWANSVETKMPTGFKNKQNIKQVLENSGYKAEDINSFIKTYIGENGEFFIWEEKSGVWYISFTNYHTIDFIKNFIIDIEKECGKQMFFNSLKEIDNMNSNLKLREKAKVELLEKKTVNKIPTSFVEKNILLNTLKDYGVKYKELQNESILCSINDENIKFIKLDKGYYVLEVENKECLKDIYNHIKNIEIEYKNNVQGYTYERVLEKIDNSSMIIEDEEILEDDSIVLTINI